MKQFLSTAMVSLLLWSCTNLSHKDSFSVSGDLKNAADQHIYLEELYFSQKDPAVLDTAELKNGKFELKANAPEQGLYRIRLEKNDAAFIFINDQSGIPFSADLNNLSIKDAKFNTPANGLLRNFMATIDEHRKVLENKSALLEQYKNAPVSDSLTNLAKQDYTAKEDAFKTYVISYIDSTSNPVMAMFSMGYTRNIDPVLLQKSVSSLSTRFPKNESIATIVAQYNQMIAQYQAKPHEGGLAPDIKMADTSGKPFALSMLRGKYVLVDFWASWCGPCRGENPNVVKAFNNFKNKNFTVLGVSLDKDRESWIKAINADKLNWYHISDLKYWSSAAVSLYGFDGIPYNVLVSPEGKILASNLRGEALEAKLAEYIK